MTVTQLEYIIAVDTYRHFASAAEQCFVTQPTLSMQIQKLEEKLCCKIFDRSKQPVVPTTIGIEVINQARIALNEIKKINHLVNNKSGIVEGELKIGIIPTLAPYLLPLFLNPFLKKYPNVTVKVKEMITDTIVEELKKGKIDTGILVTPLQENSIKEYPIFYEELVAFVSKNHNAYKKNYVLADDIDLKELWLLEEGHCFRSQILNLCELKKQTVVERRFEYEAGSVETLKKMVEINNGITIIPELATLDFGTKQLNMIRKFKSPAPVREVSIVTHRDYIKSNLIKALKEQIASILPQKILLNKNKNLVKI
jgi:LysR family transcriptional regulator, hydrogen peroxide-inducible genes activator